MPQPALKDRFSVLQEAEIEQFKRTVRQLSEANTNASKRHKEELDQVW